MSKVEQALKAADAIMANAAETVSGLAEKGVE